MWKLAFGVTLMLLILVSAFGVYFVVDQAIALDYQGQGYTATVEDMNALVGLLENSGQPIADVEDTLDRLGETVQFVKEGDTIYLNRLELRFANGKLSQITDQY